jgi:hypothetical protein
MSGDHVGDRLPRLGQRNPRVLAASYISSAALDEFAQPDPGLCPVAFQIGNEFR